MWHLVKKKTNRLSCIAAHNRIISNRSDIHIDPVTIVSPVFCDTFPLTGKAYIEQVVENRIYKYKILMKINYFSSVAV